MSGTKSSVQQKAGVHTYLLGRALSAIEAERAAVATLRMVTETFPPGSPEVQEAREKWRVAASHREESARLLSESQSDLDEAVGVAAKTVP